MDKIKTYIYFILATLFFTWPIFFIGDSLKEPYGITAIGCFFIWLGTLFLLIIGWFFISAWIGVKRAKNNPTYSLEYDGDQSLYDNMKRMVKEELNSSDEFRNEWIPKAKEISKVANTTKKDVIDWINNNPKKLFDFGYSQYQDPSAPLYNISIPLIKASGILGYTDALLFVASHCINRLDRNESTYGLALLNELSEKNVSGAKLILAYLYYNGNDNLNIEINAGKAAELLYDIQNEECFLEDGDALTMFAMLIDGEIIEVNEENTFINFLDKNGSVKKTKNLSIDKKNMSLWNTDGSANTFFIYNRGAALGNPFATTILEAMDKKDKSLMKKISESFERGYFFTEDPNPNEEIDLETQIQAKLYFIRSGSGHWKGRFDIGNLVPISPSMAEIWKDMIEELA